MRHSRNFYSFQKWLTLKLRKNRYANTAIALLNNVTLEMDFGNTLPTILFFAAAGAMFSCASPLRTQKDITYYFEIDGAISSYTTRHYLNDSVFIEKLLSIHLKELQCCDTFKRTPSSLYYRLNGDFYPYFSKEAFLKGDTVFRFVHTDLNKYHTALKFIPASTSRFRNKKVYGFCDLYSKEGATPDDQYIVYFLPGFGVVRFNDHRSGLSTIKFLSPKRRAF